MIANLLEHKISKINIAPRFKYKQERSACDFTCDVTGNSVICMFIDVIHFSGGILFSEKKCRNWLRLFKNYFHNLKKTFPHI